MREEKDETQIKRARRAQIDTDTEKHGKTRRVGETDTKKETLRGEREGEINKKRETEREKKRERERSNRLN